MPIQGRLNSIPAEVSQSCTIAPESVVEEVEVNLRQTVSRPVCLGVGLPSGAHDQILFSFLLSYRCGFLDVWHLLWREDGSVIYCTIVSGPCQSSHSWVEVPQNSRPYFTVSSETPPTWRARSPYLYAPGTGWSSYTPGHWVPFMSPLTTRRDYGGGILTRLHTGLRNYQHWILLCVDSKFLN
jgi:hypothetical protein